MEFWLSYNNYAEKLQLPVNPSEFKLKVGNNNETVNIVDLGELNRIGGEKLSEIELASFFPAQYAPYCSTRNIPDPYDAVKVIEQWRKAKKPIRLIVTDTPINLSCAIEDFEYGEKGGTRDVYYTLSLKEYRFVTVSQVVTATAQKTAATTPQTQRPEVKPTPKAYSVKSGDSLYMIAKRSYGDGSKWKQIYTANIGVIGKNPNLIKPGQQLVIP